VQFCAVTVHSNATLRPNGVPPDVLVDFMEREEGEKVEGKGRE